MSFYTSHYQTGARTYRTSKVLSETHRQLRYLISCRRWLPLVIDYHNEMNLHAGPSWSLHSSSMRFGFMRPLTYFRQQWLGPCMLDEMDYSP